ncbi:dihydrofolate reductase [Mucilaginibacter sp. 14171R-50]|uniref:dihydrofolate reductase family protein n=1 Tax=Mucilaginibacter sp. 14171R-50 TaxID=2703789 RepID=UPI00138C471A|nr:dihydrofolate reductase family protein [Mucilaginibacter sp. 14171R-50]QHS54551.1 dihydrofolate reductase [Mucilaginibacter sp. 14171R-50]
MRKLIVSMNVSLNGFMAGPHGELDWHASYWDEEMARVTASQLGDADTLLLGRITYCAMAPYWSALQANAFGARVDMDYADLINRCQKVVFSKTLNAVSWQNSRLAQRSLSKEIKALKAAAGKSIVVYGSGKLVWALNRLNLVDEYRIWVHPVLLSKGRPLFKTKINIRPYKTSVFNTGVVLIYYKTGAVSG